MRFSKTSSIAISFQLTEPLAKFAHMRRSVLIGGDDIHELVSLTTSTMGLYKPDLFARLKSAFGELDNPGEIFLAICAEDSSIVYYKLSAGINKPPV